MGQGSVVDDESFDDEKAYSFFPYNNLTTLLQKNLELAKAGGAAAAGGGRGGGGRGGGGGGGDGGAARPADDLSGGRRSPHYAPSGFIFQDGFDTPDSPAASSPSVEKQQQQQQQSPPPPANV
jgi:hypothetical protein